MELDARRAIAQGTRLRWRFKSLFEAPDATHPARRVINKQGGRNAESRCQFFSVFSVNFLFPLKTRDTIDLLPISEDRKGLNHIDP